MNLETLTPGQRESVEHLDGPLLISAGAGSGKTFTLTQRLVYALSEESGKKLGGVDELLTITFTNKAAGELISRVRTNLRNEGLDEDARQIDGAWISTIHSMCRRIIETHALDIGMDPSLVMLSEVDAREIRARAVNEVIEAVRDDERYRALFFDYSTECMDEMLKTLSETILLFPGGDESICLGPKPRAVRETMTVFEDAVEVSNGRFAQLNHLKPAQATPIKGMKRTADMLELLESARVEAFGAPSSSTDAQLREQQLAEQYANLLSTYFPAKVSNGSDELKEAAADEVQAFADAVCELVSVRTYSQSIQLVNLAKQVNTVYRALKDQANGIDTNDLLALTHEILTKNPQIAALYRERFKLVMVDEFQDTDQLQIDIVESIVGEDDATLCTVGDEQQSIYGFRGADVAVYRAHKTKMACVGAKTVELDENFRSHPDVLALVNRVFEQDQVFGDALIRLIAKRKEPNPPLVNEGVPRVRMMMAGSKDGGGSGPMREILAQRIAKQFAELREVGRAPGEMVILLGGMTNADVYARAVRNQGMECITAGGSKFFTYPEVIALISALNVLSNPYDSASLVEMLASPIFGLSDDELLSISSVPSENGRPLRAFDGLAAIAASDGLESITHANEVISRALHRLDEDSVASTLTTFIEESGWDLELISQGVEGAAAFANVIKLIDQVRELERGDGYGVARIAERFRLLLENEMRDKPGVLVSDGCDAVRIMTIHASKGLEFPIVALAEFARESGNDKSKVLCETFNRKIHVALRPSGSWLDGKGSVKTQFEKARKADDGTLFDVDAPDSGTFDYLRALEEHKKDEELSESRRLFYVGCTRAREVLIIGFVKTNAFSLSGVKYSGVLNDLQTGLFEGTFPAESTAFDFGGSAEGLFERFTVEKDQTTGEYIEVLPVADYGSEGTDGDEAGALAFGTDDGIGETFRTSQDVAPTPDDSSAATAEMDALERFIPELAAMRAHSMTSRIPRHLSYSALALHEKKPEEFKARYAPVGSFHVRTFSEDILATDVGSAFHLLAQYLAERNLLGTEQDDDRAASLTARADAVAAGHRLTGEYRRRLDETVLRWAASAVAQRAATYDYIYPEQPFCIKVGNSDERSGFFLEGAIDLLCLNRGDSRAFVVDYKTGGLNSAGSGNAVSAEELSHAYALQARCYAYVLFAMGMTEVEMVFVRPEVVDADGDIQEIRFTFSQEVDRPVIEDELFRRYANIANDLIQ